MSIENKKLLIGLIVAVLTCVTGWLTTTYLTSCRTTVQADELIITSEIDNPFLGKGEKK